VFIAAQAGPVALTEQKLRALAPFVFSLALHLKSSNQVDVLIGLKSVFALLPDYLIPDFLKEQLPEIFA
jgi:hypothetical protein